MNALRAIAAPVITPVFVRWIAMLGLTAAYLQGGINKRPTSMQLSAR